MHRITRSILSILALSLHLNAQMLLERVDAGFEDRDELATSLYAFTQVDLQHDRAFTRLYVDPLDPNALIRVDGALTASFPRSDYTLAEQGGIMPIVPAGVVYSIGARQADWQLPPQPDELDSTSLSERQNGLRSAHLARVRSNLVSHRLVDRGNTPRAVQRTPGQNPTTDPFSNAVMSTESYRRVRLRELSEKLSPIAIEG